MNIMLNWHLLIKNSHLTEENLVGKREGSFSARGLVALILAIAITFVCIAGHFAQQYVPKCADVNTPTITGQETDQEK